MNAYELNEVTRFIKQINEIERAPLAERKEGASDYHAAMRNEPAQVATLIGYLLDGSYGQGAYLKAWECIHSRMNKPAYLSQVIAALEYRCPADMARKMWHALTPEEKTALDHAIQTTLKTALDNE